jgi:hypothetical protein
VARIAGSGQVRTEAIVVQRQVRIVVLLGERSAQVLRRDEVQP